MPRKFCFQFGKLKIDSHLVRRASLKILFMSMPITEDLISDRGAVGFYEMAKLSRFHATQSLPITLESFRNRSSADPRDKVYSLLGLVPDIEQVVRIDYTISTEQLFQDVTLAYIQKHQGLKILSHLRDPATRVHRNMPSFVVDWSDQPSSISITALYRRNELHNDVFGACKDSKAIWHLAQVGHVRANGFIFDSIEAVVAERILESDNMLHVKLSVYQAIVDMANNRGDKGQEQTLADIRHTLCMDCGRFKPHEGPTYIKLQGEDHELLLNAYWEAFLNPSDPAGEDRFGDELTPIEHTVVDAVWDRIFIFTKGGRMGLAPHWCKPGDAIAIMGGGAVPMVLRPLGEEASLGDRTPVFEVVGEAYVQGVMDGQAFDANGRTDGNLDNIYLV